MNKLTSKQRKNLIRILISFALFVALLVIENAGVIPMQSMLGIPAIGSFGGIQLGKLFIVAWLIPYFIVGYDVVRNCIHGITHGQMFDESFLMTLATVGAFACGEYAEAVAVMLFYQVGELFQDYAVGKSRNAIQELMSIAPDYANRENADGSVEIIDPDDVEIGDILIIKPGEKIPVDAVVIQGEGYINTSALTGESMPAFAKTGDEVISGCVNGESLLKVQAAKLYDDSTVSQILELVENAASKKSKTEKFITRFARYYTPIVVLSGVAIAFIPPIFAGNLGMWILRACTFLVISCPCALVISVPLAFFGGIGAASRIGVLVKGSNYLEMMAKLDTLVTDKTGTLTEGRFKVTMVEAVGGYKVDEVVRYAAAIENGSTHPIALSIVEACKKPYQASRIKNIENIAGKGIRGKVGRSVILAGNAELFKSEKVVIPFVDIHSSNTIVYVARDGKYIGNIEVSDSPKQEAKKAIFDIISEGVKHVVMLTGDSEETAVTVAAELGITEFRAKLLPQNKVEVVENLIKNLENTKSSLAFVGDGINDAPVLARADVGIAMGSLGSDAAIEAADIVIMDDKISKIPRLIRIARKTVGISKTNIVFALAVKFACLVLGALGIANMWWAVFADVGVAVICIINSMRMLISRQE